MNLPSIYVGLAIVVLVLLPFLIGALRRRAKEKAARQEFFEIGRKYGIEISETETWNDRVMGLDVQNKKLLFRHTPKNEQTEILIDLNNVASCSSEIKHLKTLGTVTAIESIQLYMKMKEGKSVETISIYFADSDLNVYSEVQIAEEWAKKINDLVV